VKPQVSDRTRRLEAYTPGEQPVVAGLVKLNTNENPYPPSPRVVEAIAREAGAGLNLYPSPMADPLRAAAARRYGLTPAQVLAGNGSDELLAIVLRACAVEGDRVVYCVPTYSLYRTLVAIAGAVAVEIPTETNGRVPESLASTDARVAFLCSPNSPFGYSISPDEVSALAERFAGLIVVDEAYVDFGDRTALGLIERHANVLVLRTFSKSFSLAGLRLGLAFGNEALVGELAKVKDSYNVSRLAIAAGVAALDDYDWMLANVARVRATRERVASALREVGYRVAPSAANFLWVDCGRRGGRAVYEALRAQDVLVRHFDTSELRGGVRVTIGTDAQMDRFLAALPPC